MTKTFTFLTLYGPLETLGQVCVCVSVCVSVYGGGGGIYHKEEKLI